MSEFWAFDFPMREGKRIWVEATHIATEGARVFFLTPEQYAQYKLVRDSGGDFPFTHAITLAPPAAHHCWTPPTMGTWWVLMCRNSRATWGVQMVDASSLN